MPGLLSRPDIFLHDFNLFTEQALVLYVNQRMLQDASFLDNRFTQSGVKGAWMPMQKLLDDSRCDDAPVPSNFIFHIGHCGSTLLSRLLASNNASLGLREPQVLRQMSDWKMDLDKPESLLSESRYKQLFDTQYRLLTRRFNAAQPNIVKMTSSCNNLAGDLMAQHQASKAVLLYLPLKTYMAIMLRNQDTYTDVLGAVQKRARLFSQLHGQPFKLADMNAAQRVAMSWFVEMSQLAALHKQYPERTMLVNFDDFLLDNEKSLAPICQFFNLDNKLASPAQMANSEILNQYSKSPSHRYSAQQRRQEIEASLANNRDLISIGFEWCKGAVGLSQQQQLLQTLLH